MTDVTAEPTEELELGPIDYIVVEYPNGHPTGEALPYLIDLVDRGIVRILDMALVVKAEDGSHHGVTLAELPEVAPEFAVFEGASTGMLDDEDLAETAGIIEPGSAAAILVYENSWAGPFAAAVRRAGGQLVSSGRIPTQAVLAALEALDNE